MAVHALATGIRPALAINLDLSHGRPGASARVELIDRDRGSQSGPGGTQRFARVSLRGCIDAVAAGRLQKALEDLAQRDLDQVLLDCAQVRHIDFRHVPDLIDTLVRLDGRSGGVVLCGLSRYLRDLFRLAGFESRLRCWDSSDDLLEAGPRAPAPGRERAS
jgi:anti-anti-sigma factor